MSRQCTAAHRDSQRGQASLHCDVDRLGSPLRCCGVTRVQVGLRSVGHGCRVRRRSRKPDVGSLRRACRRSGRALSRRHVCKRRLRTEEIVRVRIALRGRLRGCRGLRLDRRRAALRLADVARQQDARNRTAKRQSTETCSRAPASKIIRGFANVARSQHDPDRQRPYRHRRTNTDRHGRLAARARISGTRTRHHFERSVLSRGVSRARRRRRRRLHRRRVCRHLCRPRRSYDTGAQRVAVSARVRRRSACVRRRSTSRETHRSQVRRDGCTRRVDEGTARAASYWPMDERSMPTWCCSRPVVRRRCTGSGSRRQVSR